MKHGNARRGRLTKAYIAWRSMHDRCGNPKNKKYSDYGGRGIAVCETWGTFSEFHRDMGDPPPRHSLERVDNSKGYFRENCRWATHREQCNNRRTTHLIEIDGVVKSRKQWSLHFGVRPKAVDYRILELGWDPLRALTTPFRRRSSPRDEARGGVEGSEEPE